MNKKLNILFAVAFCFFTNALSAADFKAQLDTAEQCYKSARYEQAIATYEQIVDNGFESAELYFNLGNAYFKSNKFPMAIVNYERALKLNPTDEDIQFNLQLANTYVVDKIDVLPEFFLKSWGQTFVQTFSTNQWAHISIACFVIGLALLLVFFLSQSIVLRKCSFWIGVLAIIVSVLGFSFSGKQKDAMVSTPDAIVVAPSVIVKGSPDVNGVELFVVHEGLKVKVSKNLDGWFEIKLSDGNKGWVKTETIVII